MYKFLYKVTFVGVTARTHILFIVLWTRPHKFVQYIFSFIRHNPQSRSVVLFILKTKSLLHTSTETYNRVNSYSVTDSLTTCVKFILFSLGFQQTIRVTSLCIDFSSCKNFTSSEIREGTHHSHTVSQTGIFLS
jgi:hypothetical protein